MLLKCGDSKTGHNETSYSGCILLKKTRTHPIKI